MKKLLLLALILNALSLIVIKDICGFLEFAINGVAVQRFNRDLLRVRIVVARFLKNRFSLCELLD